MIRMLLIVLGLIYLALPVHAQVLQVRSGEHDTFSRLTIAFPERLEWFVEAGQNEAVLAFKGGRFSLDTGAVFERIPKDRLQNVVWNEAARRLEFAFGCNCALDIFWHGTSLLVLDVRPRADDGDAATAQISVGNARDLPPRPQSPATSLLIAGLPEVAGHDDGSDESEQRARASQDMIGEARAQLLRQVSRAASQGLVTPRSGLAEHRDRSVPEPKAEKDPPRSATSQANALHPQINLRAESSIDQDFLSGFSEQAEPPASPGCIPDGLVDVASWGTAAPFGTQVSALRLRLTGEFDAPDPRVATELARLYLFFGFGAEALDMLRLVPTGSTDRTVLEALAAIADDGVAPSGSVLANQMDCGSVVALWSALSYEMLPTDLPLDGDSLLRAFNALPAHLRTHYGPDLSRRLVLAGQPEIAAKILRILDRPNASATPQIEMARAQALSRNGNSELAEERLQRVIESNSEVSAAALIEAIEERVNRGEAVSLDQAQLAAAYAFEQRDSPLASTLLTAHIKALASASAYAQAFETLAQHQGELPKDKAAQLRAAILTLLTENAEDMMFLRYTLGAQAADIRDMSPGAENAAARRLIDLGFPESARMFVAQHTPQSSPAARDRQILRAEIALLQDRPRQALVELLDLVGDDANLLRARALASAGEHDAAYRLFASSNQIDLAREQAWLSGDWRNASDPGVPAYADLAEMMTPNGAEATDPLPELAQKRALLDASGQTRETVRALLAANPLPAAETANR